MRKELIWAGIIGILFGLIIGFGVWRARSSMISLITPSPKPTSEETIVKQFKIEVNKPNNYAVITDSLVTVSGITKPLTWVIVSSEEEDYLVQSSSNGAFSADVELTSGINHIKATSTNIYGDTASQKILVVFSSSFQTNTPSSTPNTATDEASMDESVAQKITEAKNPPKAYIGTVTDITDSTIQIKTIDSQIQQIATDKYNVSAVNVKGTNNKTVKLADVAIGDFIVAMGYVDGNEVLDVQRILIADEPAKTEIAVSMAKVSNTTKKSLTLTPVNGGETITITPDKNTTLRSFTEGKTKNIKIADFSQSDTVITISDTTGSPSIVRSIFNIGK